jgi:hypothetical protein
VRVDLTKEGPQLADVPRSKPAYSTSAYGDDALAAEERIRTIVSTNVGDKTGRLPPRSTPTDVAKL